MIQTARLPLTGPRNVVFLYTISIDGADLSAATLKMQIREYPDTPGSPLVDLAMAAANAQGLSVTVDSSGILPVSTIQIRINKSTMQGLPDPTEPGGDTALSYDLIVTGGGFTESVWFEGPFTVEGSVTR